MKRIALFFAIAVAAIACTNEETVTPELKVTSETADLVIPTEGGELTLTFNVNVDWTAEVKEAEAKEWCSLSPTSGKPGDNTLKVIALENEGDVNRTVTVVLKAMEATQEIVVTQLQKDALVLTGKKEFEVPYQGENLKFAVSHNSELKAVASVDWITEVKAKATVESTLEFAVAPNTGDAREGKITFTAGSLKEEVTVKQAAWQLEFTVTPEDEAKTFEAEGGEYKVTVAANVEYDVTVPENDWLTVADAEGVYTFKAAANTVPATREVVVTIAPKDEKHAESAVTIKINQKGAGAKLEVTPTDDKWLSCDAATFEVNVDTNLELEVTYGWDAEGVEPWISYTEAAGVYTFAVAENAGQNLRSAFVYITPKDEAYADLKVTLSVFQNGRVSIAWTKVPTIDYSTYVVGGPVQLAVYGEYILLANQNKIHAIDPEDGSLVQTYNLPDGFVCETLCVDEGGNIIISNEGVYSCDGADACEIMEMYLIKSLESAPEKFITYHPANIWGHTTGNLHIEGNVNETALITAVASGASYWLAWSAENGEVENDDNGWSVWKANTLPYTHTTAIYASVVPAGSSLSDGLWYIGYGGDYSIQYCADPSANEWVKVCDFGEANTISSALAITTLNGKEYVVAMAGAVFNYADPYIKFIDVTDKSAGKVVYNSSLTNLVERNDDWSLKNWQAGASASADVIAIAAEDHVKVYFVDAMYNLIGCATIR